MFDHVRSVIVEDHRESGVPPVENIELHRIGEPR
jgi:hypothetical protein